MPRVPLRRPTETLNLPTWMYPDVFSPLGQRRWMAFPVVNWGPRTRATKWQNEKPSIILSRGLRSDSADSSIVKISSHSVPSQPFPPSFLNLHAATVKRTIYTYTYVPRVFVASDISRRGGEIDAVEGIALAKVGGARTASHPPLV